MPRSLPERPHLDHYRKQAKALLRALRDHDASAVRRWRDHHPAPDLSPQLAGAQLVIAREHGFDSWPRLRSAVELQRLTREERAARLVSAACSSQLRHALTLLEADASLARHNLATACVCGEVQVVADRLDRDPGALQERLTDAGQTPLLLACHSRFLRWGGTRAAGVEAVIHLLLDGGADPNHVFFQVDEPRAPQSALYGVAGIANHPGLTRRLLEAGADVNDTSPEPDPTDPLVVPWGPESLYHASEFPDPACLKLLLDARPYPLCVSYCLGRALDFDYPEHVRLYLAAGADPNFRVPWQGSRTHLMKAVMEGRSPETIAALLDAGANPGARDDDGVAILQFAVRRGSEQVVDLLERAGADASVVTDADRDAGRTDPWLLSDAAARNDIRTLRRMLDAGADPNALHEGLSALHRACWTGQAEAVTLLLARGGDPDLKHSYDGDALGAAIHGSTHCFEPQGGGGMRLPDEVPPRGYATIAKRLIAAGARLPAQIDGGSDAVQDVLRRHGVPDPVN